MFWSDLGPKVGYEAIGIIDSTLPTVSVFAKRGLEDENPATDESTSNDAGKLQPTDLPTPQAVANDQPNTDDAAKQDDFDKGVIFYLRDEKIIGIVLWNVFNRINTARAVISENKKYDDLNEVEIKTNRMYL
jgi:programmed cell death 8 (apoptosis-inducing factor)